MAALEVCQIPKKEGKTTKFWQDIQVVSAFFKKKIKKNQIITVLPIVLWIGSSFRKTILKQFKPDAETMSAPLCLFYFQTVLR